MVAIRSSLRISKVVGLCFAWFWAGCFGLLVVMFGCLFDPLSFVFCFGLSVLIIYVTLFGLCFVILFYALDFGWTLCILCGFTCCLVTRLLRCFACCSWWFCLDWFRLFAFVWLLLDVWFVDVVGFLLVWIV